MLRAEEQAASLEVKMRAAEGNASVNQRSRLVKPAAAWGWETSAAEAQQGAGKVMWSRRKGTLSPALQGTDLSRSGSGRNALPMSNARVVVLSSDPSRATRRLGTRGHQKWRVSRPCCSRHLVFGSAQLHIQPLSCPGLVAEGSLHWVVWTSLSQLDENGVDILSLKQQRWPGLEKEQRLNKLC